MCASRTTRFLVFLQARYLMLPQARCRTLHISPKHNDKARRKTRSIKAQDLGLISEMNEDVPSKTMFPAYDADDQEALKNIYTEEQLKAIEAGEAAIDPEDLKNQGVIRQDMGALPYFDNFDLSRAALDRKKEYEGPYDPELREANMMENIGSAMQAAHEVMAQAPDPFDERNTGPDNESDDNFKPIISRLNVWKILDKMSLAMGKDGPIPRNHGQVQDFTAPGLPRSFLPKDKKASSNQAESDPRDPDGVYNKLIAQTGLTLDEILDYKIKVLVQHRVSNQTRLGKVPGQYVLAIAGNGNGRLGLGEAKGGDGGQTLNLAKISAIRNMRPIPRYESRTIFGEVDAKVSAVKVKLMARPPGKLSLNLLALIQLSIP